MSAPPQVPAPARRVLKVVGMTAATFVMVTMVMYYAAFAQLMYTKLHMNDFGKFYYSAQAFLNGQDMYGPTPATEIPVGPTEKRQFWNMNPPHFHLLILPFALLAPLPALVAWAVVNVMALIASLVAIFRELDLRWSPTRVYWTSFMVLIASSTGATVITGQLSFLLMLPITLAWIAARNSGWTRAALWLGLLVSIKPFLGLFGLFFLVTRRWWPAVAMAASGASCFAIGWLIFGAEAHQSWIRTLSSVVWESAPMNGSIAALFSRAFDVSPLHTPITVAPSWIDPLTRATSAIVLATSLALTTRDCSSGSSERAFAGLVLTSQLVSPLGWVYYLCFLTGPILALVLHAESIGSIRWRTVLLLALPGLVVPLPLLTGEWVRLVPWVGLTWGSLHAWTMLGLWAALIYDGLATRRQRLGQIA